MQTSPELTDDSKYSQVSPAAVVALLLGIASLSALIGPLFFLLPAAAIGLALVALGKIRRSDGALSGQTLAHLAIALALICVVGALVRGAVRDSLLQRQAQTTAERWFKQLADGKIAEARALLSGDAASSLVPRPAPGVEPPAAEEMEAIAIERLTADPLTRGLAEVKSSPQLENISEPVFEGTKTVVVGTFLLGDPATGSHRHVQVQLARNPYYEAQGEPWRVDRWDSGQAHGAH